MASLWKTHPLSRPRLALLINAVPSLLFAIIAIASDPYGSFVWGWHIFLAIASALVSGWDLLRWGAQKAGNPDAEPKYPLKIVTIIDIILAVIFGLVFIGEVGSLGSYSYYDRGIVAIQAYGSVTAIFATVLHACCFWKQLMAKKKNQWRSALFSDSKPDSHPLKIVRCPTCANAVGLTYKHPHGLAVLDRTTPPPRTHQDPAKVDIESYAGISGESDALLTPSTDRLVSTARQDTDDAGTHAFGYGTLASDTVKKMKSRKEKPRQKGKGKDPTSLQASLVDVDEQDSS